MGCCNTSPLKTNSTLFHCCEMPKIEIHWLRPVCRTKQGFGVTKEIKSCCSTKSPHYILIRSNFCTCLNSPMSVRKFWIIYVTWPKYFAWKFILPSYTLHTHFKGSKWAHMPCLSSSLPGITQHVSWYGTSVLYFGDTKVNYQTYL